MKTFLRLAFACCLAMAAVFGWTTKASASSFLTVFAFNEDLGFGSPNGPMVEANGLIYGTTSGASNYGTLFKYDPASHATSTIHTFGQADGNELVGLATDGHGAIYGDTETEFFTLAAATGAFTTLFSSPNKQFYQPPVTDRSGNVYAWRRDGKPFGEITKFNPATGATSSVYDFTAYGDEDRSFLVVNAAGTMLYGSHARYGRHNQMPGEIFKIDLVSHTYTVLHVFSSGYDSEPVGALVINSAGILFGVTQGGGTPTPVCSVGCGRVFKIDPVTGKETTLYSFKGGSDGGFPFAGIALGPNGQIYGTTESPTILQPDNGYPATFFQFDIAKRIHSVLHVFTAAEGYEFSGPPTLASDGSIYVSDRYQPAVPKISGYLFRYIPDMPAKLPPRHGGPVLPTSVTSDAGR